MGHGEGTEQSAVIWLLHQTRLGRGERILDAPLGKIDAGQPFANVASDPNWVGLR
jgi:hypothetical protein